MPNNKDLEYLLASLDPSYQQNPLPPMGMGEFQPQQVEAKAAPMPTPPQIKMAPANLDVQREPAVEPQAEPQTNPIVKDYLAKKFNLGEYSDEKRQEVVDANSGMGWGDRISGALSAIGAGFQGRDAGAAMNARLNQIQGQKKAQIDQFDKGRQNLIASYDLDRKMTANSREDADLEQLMDPGSSASKMFQSLASKIDPSKDFSSMSGYELQKTYPQMQKLYEIDQRALERQNAAAERRADRAAMMGMRREEKEDARQLKNDERELKLAVPGFERTGEVLPKEEEAMKFRKATAVSEQLSQKLNRMKELVRDKGSFEYGGQAGQEMESLATEIQLLGKSPELYELGVLAGPDLSLLQKITADPTSLNSLFTRDSTRMKQIDSQINSIQNKIGSTAKSLGYQQKGGEQSQPQTKVIGGVTYRKVPGGWEAED